MKLQDMLGAADISRGTFNTLRSRGQLPFIERGIEGVTAQDRYQPAHLLGMLAFAKLRSLGVEPVMAGEAVNASWGDIRVISGDAPDGNVITGQCGIRLTAEGAEWFGSPNGLTGETIGGAHVNLRDLWSAYQSSLTAAEEAAA
ncbi:hypothetical protein M9978_09430 [Sphingomonas sp. MG17]|uniref:Uncharacterized protein n=2 Tax=Sphingomonas tagetis TaxID=2949092 RepID=A0A9X2KPF1_9SPHN|nr:hypothetical protein [Sphingomonas tagetis]